MQRADSGMWGCRGSGRGAPSSCLQSGRKSLQISYRDDCWSGSFHPALRGSRQGDSGKKLPPPSPQHPAPPTPETLPTHPSLMPAGGKRSAARLAARRPCSISTPLKVSHQHQLLLRRAAPLWIQRWTRKNTPLPPSHTHAHTADCAQLLSRWSCRRESSFIRLITAEKEYFGSLNPGTTGLT